LKSTEKGAAGHLRTQKEEEDSHPQHKKGLFLEKITFFKASTAPNVLGSYKIIEMTCSLPMLADVLDALSI